MTAYGCAAKVGAENKTIPTNAAAMCESQCQQAGLHMTALAIMAETIGCVCQRDASDSSSDNAGASAAGMATIMIQQEQAQQQQQQRQQQQQQ
jgi:hypothetical protein